MWRLRTAHFSFSSGRSGNSGRGAPGRRPQSATRSSASSTIGAAQQLARRLHDDAFRDHEAVAAPRRCPPRLPPSCGKPWIRRAAPSRRRFPVPWKRQSRPFAPPQTAIDTASSRHRAAQSPSPPTPYYRGTVGATHATPVAAAVFLRLFWKATIVPSQSVPPLRQLACREHMICPVF